MNSKDNLNKQEKTIHNDAVDLNEFIALPGPKASKIPQSTGENLYSANLKALEKHHPELVELLAKIGDSPDSTTPAGVRKSGTVPIEDKIKVLYSESGDPRILYKKDSGEEVYIHSAHNPVECANQAIDLLGKIEKEGVVVLFGFGLGYFAEEVFKRFEKGHVLVIYEAKPEVFKTALRIRDFSQLFDSDRVKIILGEDADNFAVIHSHHHLIANGKFWVVEHKPSVKLNTNAYDRFFKRLNEEKRLSDIGVATTIGRGKEFINAFLENVHSVIRKPGVNGLKDIFKGRPAIVVSAGPSLDKNLHLLKEAKGKAVIVATGGALPTLLSCNIIPDMVVEIDPVAHNIEDKFKGIPVLRDVPFICLAQYTPELINIYPGPLLINSVPGNIAYQWLSVFWEDKGHIECFGGSVAHLAFAAAEFVGADVIAFVGQDLSYSGDRIHTTGYSDDLDRTLEEGLKKESKNIPGAIPARNIFDEEVFTIQQFLSFKTSFENKIKEFKGTVVNATEGGLPIDGAVNMRLMDFIDEYCSGVSEMDTFSVLSALSDAKPMYNLDGLIAEVTGAKKKLEEIKRTSKQILKYIKRVKILKGKENKDSPELHNILGKVEPLIEHVKHPVLNLMVGYHYRLELYLKKQEIQDIDEIEDKWEMLDKQLDRGQVYYGEVVKAIDLFNSQLEKLTTALQREKEVDSILNDESMDRKERFYKAAMIYKKAGIAAEAAKYLEALTGDGLQVTATRHGSRITDVYVSLAEMYVKQFRFYEAKEILKAVTGDRESVTGHESRVTELLKTCDANIKEWENRKRGMERILKTAETNYGRHLESGFFYFRVKDYERAEKAYLKEVRSQKSEVRSDEERLSAAYYGLAHTYLAMEDYEKAVNALEKAIEADPKNPIPYRDLGFIAFQNNDIKAAELFLTRAIELAPQTIELYKHLADLYVGQGEIGKAASLYEDALLVNPDNSAIQQELAMIYKEMIAKTGRA
ncbi:MAG: DUF115 domain-containing protein [Nitrospirae bacterium]|nr:DUF115 domain-containing protein [Nitrospirota bacterium]